MRVVEPPPVYDDAYHRQTSFHKHPGHSLATVGNYPGGRNDYHPAYDLQRSRGRPMQQSGGGMHLPLPALPVGYSQNYGDSRYVEHVYESPKFEHGDDMTYPCDTAGRSTGDPRALANNDSEGTQYFELDPEVVPSANTNRS